MERKLAAILAADVVGYSKAMAADEAGTLTRLKAHRSDLFDPKVAEHNGRVVKLMGDGTLVEFSSVVDAVACAVAIQTALAQDGGQIELRIGINIGDVILDGDDVYGDGVNVAARLEAIAETGGICISDMVHQSIRSKTDAAFEPMGEQTLKNIERPVTTWRWAGQNAASTQKDTSKGASAPERPSIAVLPFDNMSGDPEQEYFSDGITEDIITELSRFRELFVIARNSSFSYKGKQVRVQEIGRDLGVAYIVEGSVRKAGNRVRITVQLIEASSGNHVWAERYDRELRDIFDLQDEITQTIVTLLPVRIQGALVENSRQKPSENLTAYDCFLQGRWLFDRMSGEDAKALDLLRTAIDIDPGCAPAHAYIALAHAYSMYNLYPVGDAPLETALDHIKKALSTGEGDHFIHAAAANTYIMCGKPDLADTHSAQAVKLNGNAIYALLARGYVLSYLGDPASGVEQVANALKYDPHAPDFYRELLAESSYMLRDYDKAIEIYTGWTTPPPHTALLLSICYAQAGRMEDARAAFQKHESERPEGYSDEAFARVHATMCKQPGDAEHWLEGYRKVGLDV